MKAEIRCNINVCECGALMIKKCGFVPYPDNGAYGHWSCERQRWHLGPHRFVNYTISRIPQFWHVRQLIRDHHYSRRVAQRARENGLMRRVPHPYRRTLYPATYRPVDR